MGIVTGVKLIEAGSDIEGTLTGPGGGDGGEGVTSGAAAIRTRVTTIPDESLQ